MGLLSRWKQRRASERASLEAPCAKADGVAGDPARARGNLEATPLDSWDLEPEAMVTVPIGDALDLHSFRPSEIKDVVGSYLDAVCELGLREVRIIHGRGIGVQRETVRKVLERDSRVESFRDAEAPRGGWGATVVCLRHRDPLDGPPPDRAS
jgi:DNA-nicking Smr family endonuclease